MNQTSRRLFVVVTALGLLSACPAPFEQQDLVAGFDESPPIIALATPIDGDSYGSAVYVSGTVTDTADSGAPGQVSSLTCAVVSLLPSTAVTLNASDGSFGFLVDCGTFSGTIVLELTARDWNGNELVHTVNLVDVESDIPSFQLVPGNEKITASWSPVPSATGYTLYEYVSGFTTTLTDDITTYEYTGLPDEPLRNGDLVLLQLKADMGTDYRAAWSDTETCVSLSEFTLMPYTRSGDGEVTVEWYDAPAVDRYTVYRSTSRDPATFVVHRIVNGTSFTDRDVADNTIYYYRVCPNGQTDILSGIVPGTPHSIPTAGIQLTGDLPSELSAPVIGLVNGDDLFTIGRAGGGSTSPGGVEWYDITNPGNPVLHGSLEFDDVHLSWGDFLAAADSDGRLYVNTRVTNGPTGFVTVNTAGGVLTQGNAFTWDHDSSFAAVEDVFYYTDSAVTDEFYYVATDDLESADSGEFTTEITTGTAVNEATFDTINEPDLDFNTPALLAACNRGGTDYLYVIDSFRTVDGTVLTNQFNLFAITLVGNEPDDSTAVGYPPSDVFASAYAGGSGNWEQPAAECLYQPVSLTADEGVLVFVAEMETESDDDPKDYGVAIYDISTPVSPTYKSAFMVHGVNSSDNLGLPYIDDSDADGVGDRLLIPDGMNYGIHIYDISDLAAPAFQQFISTPGGFPSTVVAAGTRYFVTSDSGGTVILDETIPGAATATNRLPSGMPLPSYVDIVGDRAYVMGTDGYLYLLETGTNGLTPVLRGETDLGFAVPDDLRLNSVFAFGNLLAVVSAGDGVTLVDVIDLTTPREITTLLADNQPTGALRYGDVVYVSCRVGGVRAYDIADPDTPVFIDSISLPGKAWGQTRFGSTLFYSLDSGKAVTVDVSDPYHFEMLDYETVLEGTAYLMTATEVDNRVYIGSMGNGASVATVDVKTPQVLTDLSNVDMQIQIPPIPDGAVVSMAMLPISEEMLIDVAVFFDDQEPFGDPGDGYGAHLISIADPDSPGYVTHLNIPATVTSGAWFGNWGYFADPTPTTGGLLYVNLGE